MSASELFGQGDRDKAAEKQHARAQRKRRDFAATAETNKKEATRRIRRGRRARR